MRRAIRKTALCAARRLNCYKRTDTEGTDTERTDMERTDTEETDTERTDKETNRHL